MKRKRITAAALLLMLVLCAAFASPAWAEGCAPVAQNLELKTYRNVSAGGSLSAYDPDGDVVGYEITTKPVKGTLQVKDDGSFVYTPRPNKRGKDYFGYKAIDAEGNRSQEATAIIHIEKQKSDLQYEDMRGRAGEYAAIELSESGVFTGEKLGERYCFFPDRPVQRGEFLEMCMLSCRKPLINGVFSTGYSDDADMSDHTKALVATAAMGDGKPRSGAYDADALITLREAAVIQNQMLGLYDVSNEGTLDETMQACCNLASVGVLILPEPEERLLTREMAAEMLVKAMALNLD